MIKKRNIRSSSGIKIEETTGFFMIAKKCAASAIINKLSGTQCRLWLYLMMTDPFADLTSSGEKIYHPIPSPQDMAIKIGASVGTVEKDMRKLKKLQLYDYRTTAWQGYNQTAAQAKEESNQLKRKKAKTVAGQREGLNKPLNGLNKPQEELNNPQKRLNNPIEKAKSQGTQEICSSPQTYSDFIKSLSDDKRENFLDFVKNETRNLEKPINDIEAWLASKTRANRNRWEVYYQKHEDYRVNEPSKEIQLDSRILDSRIAEFQKQI